MEVTVKVMELPRNNAIDPSEKCSIKHLQFLTSNGWERVAEKYVALNYRRSVFIGGVIVLNHTLRPIMIASKDGAKQIVERYGEQSNTIVLLKPVTKTGTYHKPEEKGLCIRPGEKPDMTDNVYWYKKVITYSKFQVENSNKGYYYCCDPGDPDIVITSTDQEFPYDTKEFVDFVYPPTPYDFEKISRLKQPELSSIFEGKLPIMKINDPKNKLHDKDVFWEIGSIILRPIITHDKLKSDFVEIIGPKENGEIGLLFSNTGSEILSTLYTVTDTIIIVKSKTDSLISEVSMSMSRLLLVENVTNRQTKLDKYDELTKQICDLKQDLLKSQENCIKLEDTNSKLKNDNRDLKEKVSIETLNDKIKEREERERIREEAKRDLELKRKAEDEAKKEAKINNRLKFHTTVISFVKAVVISALSVASAVIMWRLKFSPKPT